MANAALEMKGLKELKDENDQCSICLDTYVNQSRLECGHTFCFQCLSDWSKKKKACPCCRKEFATFHTFKPNGESEIHYVPTPIIKPSQLIENLSDIDEEEDIIRIIQLWGDVGFQFILKTWMNNVTKILNDELSGLDRSDPEYLNIIYEQEALEFIPQVPQIVFQIVLQSVFDRFPHFGL